MSRGPNTPLDHLIGERGTKALGRFVRGLVFAGFAAGVFAYALQGGMRDDALFAMLLAGLSALLAAAWPYRIRRLVPGIESESVSSAFFLLMFPLLAVSVALGEAGAYGLTPGGYAAIGAFAFVMVVVAGVVLYRGRRHATGRINFVAQRLLLAQSGGIFSGPIATGKTPSGQEIVATADEDGFVLEMRGFDVGLVIAPARLLDLKQRISPENVTTGDPAFDEIAHLRSPDPIRLLSFLDTEARRELLVVLRFDMTLRDGVLRWRESNDSPIDKTPLDSLTRLSHLLANFSPRDVFESLAEAAEREPLAESRIVRLSALAKMSAERARPSLERALSDSHGGVRAAAAELILADTRAPAALIAAAKAERLRLASADGRLSIAAADEAGALSIPAAQGALALGDDKKKR